MQITPAILPSNYEQVMHDLFRLEGAVKRVQIDLCDGRFGLEKTWLPYEEKELPAGFEYEFDLMVYEWEKFLHRVIKLGAKRVIMHIDYMTEEELGVLVRLAKDSLITLGLSVSNDKDMKDFAKKVKSVGDSYSKIFVQLMGIKNIGAQGQPFDSRVIDHISYIKKECRGIQIQIDGSINLETLLKVKNAGATGVVIGSYLFGSGDIAEKISMLHARYG